MQFPLLFRFCLLLTVNEAKVFQRCQLAQILKKEGMDGYRGYSLADWLCVLYYTSGYDTKFRSRDIATHNRYGIFQIDSRDWCRENCVHSRNKCDIWCKMMENDDLRDDIACTKVIVSSPTDMDHWPAWRDFCEGLDNSKWNTKCKL